MDEWDSEIMVNMATYVKQCFNFGYFYSEQKLLLLPIL